MIPHVVKRHESMAQIFKKLQEELIQLERDYERRKKDLEYRISSYYRTMTDEAKKLVEYHG
jgi:hypothetical protein